MIQSIIQIQQAYYLYNHQTFMNRTQTAQLEKVETKQEDKKETTERVLVLNLKQKPAHRVSWTQETVDNEGMNKKKSNLCCIYHRPGDQSSDTCSSDDEGNALERDRHTKHLHKKKCSKLNKKKQESNASKGPLKQ